MKNLFPSLTTPSRLAIICEAPTKEDKMRGEKFSSNKYKGLLAILNSLGIPARACLLATISSQPKPYGNLDFVKKDDLDVEVGLAELRKDLDFFQPHCCLLMGKSAMRLFGQTKFSLDDYRGSIFYSKEYNVKCVATYDILRGFQRGLDMAMIKFDAKRAWTEAATPHLNLPDRTIHILESLGDALNFLNRLASTKTQVGFDVEGYPDKVGVTVLSFATKKDEAYAIPFRRSDGSSIFNVDEEILIWRKICELLESNHIAKISQNNMYELFMMSWRYGIVIRNHSNDTMFKHWQLYPEFEKNLGLQTSLYTREPYFKDGRQAKDEAHWVYNGKDSAILIDIDETTDALLRKDRKQYEAYKFRMQLSKPYLYMTLLGCRIDQARLLDHRTRLMKDIQEKHTELCDELGSVINTKSSKDRLWLLYEKFGFPVIKKTDPNTKRSRPTADAEAMLECAFKADDDHIRKVLRLVLDLTKARTDLSDSYKLTPFEDGRIRCNLNPVGTNTGRLSSSATAVYDLVDKCKIEIDKKTGQIKFKSTQAFEARGTNLQNVSKWLRDVFIPDEGMDFWQFDYSGADAWTVALICALEGNRHMLEHLQKGIKPSCVILMMYYYGTEVLSWTTQQILDKQPEMKADDKMYVCSKACQHGTNYGMGPALLAQTIFKRSNGTIRIDPNVAAKLQKAYEAYYQPSLFKKYVEQKLKREGCLYATDGTRRQFFGVRKGKPIDHSVLKEALSFIPQYNTTYATNCAAHYLYYHPSNRLHGAYFHNIPLLMIHDALCGQTPVDRSPEHELVLNNAFSVEIEVENLKTTIPAEGNFGPNWKMCG